ncbi:hypothetical protein PENANT_c003G04114 [Penicillium antarcticum]|uniref:Transposase Tc1-like domain-containing protein n=1 Tax=Penicillium antarcticum TaxID=416450 RepID=A0A1V6QID3_9EURO|nr:uncharacterized protein N7508_006043 [Penicillium antarcticum]KAJ5307028.1 hypothetical protein N7508_006043 [Penicillium antarcticum]OQD88994.1 hypothetical protein PENANT_c003G04114 [Penicillium antarcticum]
MPTSEISHRAALVALKATGKSSSEICAITGTPARTVNSIYTRAISRGFNPNARPLELHDSYFIDGVRSGRPSKWTDELREKILDKVTGPGPVSEKSCVVIAQELTAEGTEISHSSVRRILLSAQAEKQTTKRVERQAQKQRHISDAQVGPRDDADVDIEVNAEVEGQVDAQVQPRVGLAP